MCVCVCLFVRERLMYKSSEPKQALINGARWSAGKGKQQLNELAPPSWRIIAFHQQILVADTQTHRHTTDEGVIFFFPLSILVFVLAKLPCISQGRLLGAFLFQLYLFCFGCQLCLSVAVFIITRIGGCEGGVTTSPSVSHDVLCRSFPSLVSFRLPSFVSVSFSNNNCWIKLSGNFRGTLCYGRPSC